MGFQFIVVALLALTALLLLLLRLFSANVYDAVIVWMTARWYAAVFEKLNEGDRILDVGIGTATALVKNRELLLKKRLSVVGLDYEAAYVRKAEAVLKEADLWRAAPGGTEGYRPDEMYCRAVERSVYDTDLYSLCEDDPKAAAALMSSGKPVREDRRFDAAYFSGSLTVLPDPAAALRAMEPLIKARGRVYITQTFQRGASPVMAAIKPLLKYVTTIDFGQLTTLADLDKIIADAGVFDVVENGPIPGSLDTASQVARLIVLERKKGKDKVKQAT